MRVANTRTMQRARTAQRLVALALAALGLALVPRTSAAVTRTDFDHFTTGFELLGQRTLFAKMLDWP